MTPPVRVESLEGRGFTDGLLLVREFWNEHGAAMASTTEGLRCELKEAGKGHVWWPTDQAIGVRAAHATLLLRLSAQEAEKQEHLLCVVRKLMPDDAFLKELHLVLFGWGPSREEREKLLTLAHVRRVHGDMSTPRAYVFPLLVPGEDYGHIGITKESSEGRVLEKLRDEVTSRYREGG